MNEKWTPKDLYQFWNGRYFRSKLPDIPVVWSKVYHSGRNRRILGGTIFEKVDGILKPTRIVLNPKYKNAFVVWSTTLIHEMTHVEQWELPRKQAHCRKFQKRIKQLVALGAYNGLL